MVDSSGIWLLITSWLFAAMITTTYTHGALSQEHGTVHNLKLKLHIHICCEVWLHGKSKASYDIVLLKAGYTNRLSAQQDSRLKWSPGVLLTQLWGQAKAPVPLNERGIFIKMYLPVMLKVIQVNWKLSMCHPWVTHSSAPSQTPRKLLPLSATFTSPLSTRNWQKREQE